MDFITLAGEPRRLLRQLDQFLAEDDYDPTKLASPASSIYNTMSEEEAAAASQSPILSKNAEAELYLLATNFLLYVAMVIITTMVAKIYFPELLKRDTSTVTPRNFSYRVASEQESEDFFGSDGEDDDEDEDLDEFLDSDSAEEEAPLSSRAKSSRDFTWFLDAQDSLSKAQVLRRLLFCSLMLNITFVMWGALQVR
jgi:hypothetical protein